jgi:hypothetical protein
VFFSGHGALGSSGSDGIAVVSCGAGVDTGSLRALFTILLGGFFSAGVVGTPAGVATVLKSKAVPGVLGVLLAEPKDAKAPDPSPKADEPPVVGDASAPGVNGEMVLKGLRPPCDDVSPPKRLAAAENVRVGGWSFWGSACEVDRESLLVLQGAVSRGTEDSRAGILGAASPEVLPVIHWWLGHGEEEQGVRAAALSEAWWDEGANKQQSRASRGSAGQCASVVCGDVRCGCWRWRAWLRT